ncbi:MAG: DUF4249 family protein [Bacteroidales bacterium]|nr:DUF4249 family protein [Bacteroidales bacterium]
MKRLFLFLMMCFAVCCTVEKIDEHLVIDGWIEDGGYPVVIVTSSVALVEGTLDYDDLSKHVLRWATVSVSDGEETFFLTGMKNDTYFPPYIYTTTKFKGQAGKKYTLKVKYGETEATAETTIPAPQTLTAIGSHETAEGSTIQVAFTPSEDSYYGFFTKRDQKDSTYLACMYSLVNGSTVKGSYESFLYRGFDIMGSEFTWYYEPGDHVRVRFCTMDEMTYNYWKGLFDEWVFSRNPFFPVHSTAPSNVVGGYGYWAGYGSTYYEIDIP